MRIQANFEMNTDWLIKDYRRIFMSLIKSVLAQDSVLFTKLYGTDTEKRKTNKPFTFSIHFPEFQKFDKMGVQCGNKMNLFFSSNDEGLITAFYNGLNKNKVLEIGKDRSIVFNLKRINLLPSYRIQSDKVEFRTLSPVLVNLKGDNLNYIPPTHSEFDTAFKTIISNQAQELNIPCEPNDIQIEIKTMKKLPLTHYNQTMTSWMGEFLMEAPKEILQLVYDTGIGVRRSQGFGMLEIQKQF